MCVFGRNLNEVLVLPPLYGRHVMLTCLITTDIYLGYLLKVISFQFLYYKYDFPFCN